MRKVLNKLTCMAVSLTFLMGCMATPAFAYSGGENGEEVKAPSVFATEEEPGTVTEPNAGPLTPGGKPAVVVGYQPTLSHRPAPPVITLAVFVTGFFTATESSIVACIYALICGFFIYRTLKIGDLMGIFKRAASSSAMLMMIMGISNIYSYIFARENVTPVVEQFLLSITDNPSVLVFIIIVMMLIIGCFMETLAATAVILPTLYPIVMHMGVDPLLFGVLFSISTVVGALTPPVGLYLFLSMNIAQASFKQAISYTGPVVLIILAVMLIMWFFPPIVTYVPNLLMGA